MSVLSLCIESNDFIISYDYTMLCICTFWTINSNSMAPMVLLDKYKYHCSLTYTNVNAVLMCSVSNIIVHLYI